MTELRRSDIIIMDNLGSHSDSSWGATMALGRSGRTMIFPLSRGQRMGDAAPSVRNGAIGMIAANVSVFRFPGVTGNFGWKFDHGAAEKA